VRKRPRHEDGSHRKLVVACAVASPPQMEPDAVEIRVVGCLIEKQRTTPDVYPLTLNALRLACNQSTNRDPVVDYDENTIRGGIDRLVQRKWATLASWSNRRSMKYRHTLDGALGLDDAEMAVLDVLMLRGAQTPGELKTRTERLHRFAGMDELGETLEQLIERQLVARLDRRPGQREERYRHLIGGGESPVGESEPAPTQVAPDGLEQRLERLENEVAELRAELRTLREQRPG
jgi:uncharacterized protein